MITDVELRAEVDRVLAHLNGAEVELANGGQALAAGACSSGRYLIVALANRLFPKLAPSAETEKPDDPP